MTTSNCHAEPRSSRRTDWTADFADAADMIGDHDEGLNRPGAPIAIKRNWKLRVGCRDKLRTQRRQRTTTETYHAEPRSTRRTDWTADRPERGPIICGAGILPAVLNSYTAGPRRTPIASSMSPLCKSQRIVVKPRISQSCSALDLLVIRTLMLMKKSRKFNTILTCAFALHRA